MLAWIKVAKLKLFWKNKRGLKNFTRFLPLYAVCECAARGKSLCTNNCTSLSFQDTSFRRKSIPHSPGSHSGKRNGCSAGVPEKQDPYLMGCFPVHFWMESGVSACLMHCIPSSLFVSCWFGLGHKTSIILSLVCTLRNDSATKYFPLKAACLRSAFRNTTIYVYTFCTKECSWKLCLVIQCFSTVKPFFSKDCNHQSNWANGGNKLFDSCMPVLQSSAGCLISLHRCLKPLVAGLYLENARTFKHDEYGVQCSADCVHVLREREQNVAGVGGCTETINVCCWIYVLFLNLCAVIEVF